MNDAVDRRIARQRGSWTWSVPGRAVVASAVGMAVTASTLLGATSASAADQVVVDQVVVDQSLASVEASPGQPVAVTPSTMDSKVHDAVLLAMPLDFDTASKATDRFRALSPIVVGTVREGKTSFSGSQIAQAATPELSELGLPNDKVEDVTEHFQNLVKFGNSVTVRAEKAEPPKQPPPSEEPPSQEPPSQEPPSEQPPSEQPPSHQPAPEPPSGQQPAPEVPSAPPSTATPRLAYGAPAPVRVLPPDPTSAPGFLPFASHQVPQPAKPEVAHPQAPDRKQSADRQRQDEVRAAGKVEAMPAERSNHVALPVLLGAVSVAAVTAGLVRAWILRRG